MWILEICGAAANKTLAVVTDSAKTVFKIVKIVFPLVITTGKAIVATGKTIFIISHFFKFLEQFTGKIDNVWRFVATGSAMVFSLATTLLVNKPANDMAFNRIKDSEEEKDIDEKERSHFFKYLLLMVAGGNGCISMFFVLLNSDAFAYSLLDFLLELCKEYIIDLEKYPQTEASEGGTAFSLAFCAAAAYLIFDFIKGLQNAKKLGEAIDKREFNFRKKPLIISCAVGAVGLLTVPAFSWFSTGKAISNNRSFIPLPDSETAKLILRTASAVSTCVSYTLFKTSRTL